MKQIDMYISEDKTMYITVAILKSEIENELGLYFKNNSQNKKQNIKQLFTHNYNIQVIHL